MKNFRTAVLSSKVALRVVCKYGQTCGSHSWSCKIKYFVIIGTISSGITIVFLLVILPSTIKLVNDGSSGHGLVLNNTFKA